MLLTLSTYHHPATDLGFLLIKHPDNLHTVDLAFGSATLFYPEADEARCTAARTVEVDPAELVCGRGARRVSKISMSQCVFGVLAMESEPVDPRL